jgi:hypothetical protein
MWIWRTIRARREPSIKLPESCPTFELPARGDLMENPLTLSLWLGVALYAAIGLFGVIIFYDAAPMTQDAAGGYGISIASASAAPQAGK